MDERKNLIDILRQKYLELRAHIEKQWNEENEDPISTNMWSIIAFIYQRKQSTIAEVTKQANLNNLSRQAIHKIIKNLEMRGLVSVSNSSENKRVKNIVLTSKGIDCYERLNTIKRETEQQIKKHLGEETFQTLIRLLDQKWNV